MNKKENKKTYEVIDFLANTSTCSKGEFEIEQEARDYSIERQNFYKGNKDFQEIQYIKINENIDGIFYRNVEIYEVNAAAIATNKTYNVIEWTSGYGGTNKGNFNSLQEARDFIVNRKEYYMKKETLIDYINIEEKAYERAGDVIATYYFK